MKSYPIDKYQFKTYTDKNTGAKTIVAISTYAGRTVRGVAKCDPNDQFDMEKGKELAAARCAEKIARRRENRSALKLAEAKRALEAAQAHYDKMLAYSQDAWQGRQDAEQNIRDVFANL